MPTRDNNQEQQGKSKSTATKKVAKIDEPLKFTDGVPTVTYSISITKNLGNYESLKIGADITVPIDATDEVLERIEKFMVVARDKVVDRLSNDIGDITNALT